MHVDKSTTNCTLFKQHCIFNKTIEVVLNCRVKNKYIYEHLLKSTPLSYPFYSASANVYTKTMWCYDVLTSNQSNISESILNLAYHATVFFCLTSSQSTGSWLDGSKVTIWVFIFWVSPRCSGISLLSFLELEKEIKSSVSYCNIRNSLQTFSDTDKVTFHGTF